jgi:DNA polymerase III delta prime subunit
MTKDVFKNIIGHQTTLDRLRKLLSSKSVPHALLFSGPSGVGKRLIARRFAASLITDELQRATSLNNEEIVKQTNLVSLGTHPDLHLVDIEADKKDISVSAIRDLKNSLQLMPYYGVSKVGIIDKAHRMSPSASNALLMTLEEPSPNTYLILISEAPHRLPETIQSRCQSVNFGELSQNELYSILNDLFNNLEIDIATINELIKWSDGSLTPFQLDSLIDSHTLNINNKDEMKSHLSTIISKFKNIETKLAPLRASRDKNISVSYPVALASELANVKENQAFTWYLLRLFLRNSLRDSSIENVSHWADSFLQGLKSEQLVFERNANSNLHLTSLFLQMQD